MPSVKPKSFVWSSAVMTFTSLVGSFLAFLFNFVIVKIIDPAVYGEYNTALAYLAILSAPLTVFNLMIVRKIGQAQPSERAVLAWQLQKRLFLDFKKHWYVWSVFLIILALFLSQIANFSTHLTVIYVLIALVLSIFSTFYTAVIQAYKYFIWVGLIAIVAGIWKIFGGLVLVKQWPFLLTIYLVMIVMPLFNALASRLIAFYRLKKKRVVTSKLASFQPLAMIKKRSFLVPLLAVISTTLLLNLDLVMVKHFLSAGEVGVYSLFSLCAKILFYASQPIVNTAYTFFTGSESRHQNRRVLLLAVGAFIALGAVMLALYRIFPEFVINILGTSDYLALAPFLFLAAIFGALYSLVWLFNQYLVAKNSLLVAWPLLVCALQALAFLVWHQNSVIIMNINILSSLVFLLIYALAILHLRKGQARVAHH